MLKHPAYHKPLEVTLAPQKTLEVTLAHQKTLEVTLAPQKALEVTLAQQVATSSVFPVTITHPHPTRAMKASSRHIH